MCKANPIAQTNLQFPLFQSDMKEIRSISCLPYKTRNWVGPSDETTETEAPCHSRRGTIKIPSLLQPSTENSVVCRWKKLRAGWSGWIKHFRVRLPINPRVFWPVNDYFTTLTTNTWHRGRAHRGFSLTN